MQSLTKWIMTNRVRFSSELTDGNPNMTDIAEGSRHWCCTITYRRRHMTVYFSQGPAIEREPTLEDVLDCLASDAAGVDNARSFEEWCGEYGYDTDSRKAERIYKTVQDQAGALVRVLGPVLYQQLLWETERL